jgi:outer membrane protein
VYRRLFVSLMVGVFVLFTAGSVSTVSAEDEVRLSLDQALEMALESNLDLMTARIDPQVAGETVKIRDADFDINLQVGALTNGYEREARLVFEAPGSGDRISLDGEIRQNLKFGANYSVGLEYNKQTGSALLLDPFYQGQLTLNYSMPLLRNRGSEPTTELLVLARGNLDMSNEELRRRTELVIQSTETAYWAVVAWIEAVDVSIGSLDRAEDLLQLNKKKVEVGTLAPIEITQAEAGKAAQEETVIVNRTSLADAEDDLRGLLGIPDGHAMWNQRIIPADELVFEMVQPDLAAANARALESRPELRSLRMDLKNKQLSERVTKNQVKHGLDLNLYLQPQGNNNGGLVSINSGPDGIPNTFDDTYLQVVDDETEALTEIFKGDNYTWQASLTYSVPLGNKAAKANHRIAALNTQQTETRLRSQEQMIHVEVRKAVRGVDSGVKRIRAAEASVMLQRKKLEAEEKKFQNGMSTSFEVLTFQDDLSDSELARIRALVDYRVSLIALEKAQGTLLESRGLTLKH